MIYFSRLSIFGQTIVHFWTIEQDYFLILRNLIAFINYQEFQ